jgi:hypothetical protein
VEIQRCPTTPFMLINSKRQATSRDRKLPGVRLFGIIEKARELQKQGTR